MTRRIAYLAPELPALSATFVYEELLAVEGQGVRVSPVTVHRPSHPAGDQSALSARTLVLYDGPAWWLALRGVLALPSFGSGARKALSWLWQDMRSCGLWRAVAWKLAFQCLVATRLARHLTQQQCGHLHIHFAHVPTQIGMYASALSGVPYSVMGHANDIFERGILLPVKASRARTFFTISAFNIEHLERVGVAAEHLALLRCGVSFPAPTQWPVYEDKAVFRIGTLGRLVEKKGVEDLLRAVAIASASGHLSARVELCIAGDGPLRASLVKLAAELGLAECVQFDGALAHQAVQPWLSRLDAFVLACKRDARGDMDGIPVVLMEAMSQGIPVISTRISGIPELVIDRVTGLLADAGDPPDLANKICSLLNSAALRRDLAGAASAHVQTEFGLAINASRLLAMTASVAADLSSNH